MKKLVALLLAVLMVVALFAGCAPKADEPDTTPADTPSDDSAKEDPKDEPATEDPADETKTIKVGYSVYSKEDILFVQFEEYLKQYAETMGAEAGVNIEITYTVADDDPVKQASDIEDLLNAGNEIIVCVPRDCDAISSSVKTVQDAGKQFIAVIRAVTGETPADVEIVNDTYTNAYNSVKTALDQMIADGMSKDDIKVLNITGDVSDSNAILKMEGAQKACADVGVEIVQEVSCEWDNDVMLKNASSALTEHPEINMIFCPSDGFLTGLRTALERTGKWLAYGEDGYIYLASNDAYPLGYELVRDGYILADSEFAIAPIAEKTMECIINYANGKTPDQSEYVVSGQTMTPDNCDTLENLWGKDMYESGNY